MSPRRSLTTKVLPSRMLIRRGCTVTPSKSVRSTHSTLSPSPGSPGPYRGYCSSVVSTPEERHRRLRIAMVTPPWYEVPPVGYGGLEVIVAALVDGLVERGHEVTLFGAGNRTGTRARFVSTTGQLQYPRIGELMPAVVHTARVHRLPADGD